jgi:transcriptional regulator GlxA family with amidase domain
MVKSKSKLTDIRLLASSETSPSVLYGLYEVLSTVGTIYPELTTGETGTPLFDVNIVSADSAPFRCYGNVLVEPHAAINEGDEPDVVIVCDMYQPIDASPIGQYPREVEWVKRMHSKGVIIASACAGSLVLADTGLLDGLETAGHWAYRDMYRNYFRKVKFNEHSVLSVASEQDRLITSGAVCSWQDLAVYLIARLCGPEHAINTIKAFALLERSNGQLPFSVTTLRIQQKDAVIADCQTWIAENYSCSNPVARMCEQTGLKSHTFARRFRTATSYQPMNYVHALRLEEAKRLLETIDGSIEDIGYSVGYEDSSSFHRLFKRKAGMTPAAYRRKMTKLAEATSH